MHYAIYQYLIYFIKLANNVPRVPYTSSQDRVEQDGGLPGGLPEGLGQILHHFRGIFRRAMGHAPRSGSCGGSSPGWS